MSKKPKQDELPAMEGPGVAQVKDKALDKLGDKFIDIRDSKADLATELTKVGEKILERMEELQITTYRFADQIVKIKPGQKKIVIKTVKVDGDTGGDPEDGE